MCVHVHVCAGVCVCVHVCTSSLTCVCVCESQKITSGGTIPQEIFSQYFFTFIYLLTDLFS